MTVNPEKLKSYRKLAGVKQHDIAKHLTDQLRLKSLMPVATYSSKEINGRFSTREINIICRYLKIQPADIMADGLNDLSEIREQLQDIQKRLQRIEKRIK